jgi:DNA mismatch repair protein PMS2
VAKAVNEVYRSFNVSQSPFVFADFRMDTNAYDVNVSPDKRTILLHDAAQLIERVKACLTELFDNHEQTVPQSQFQKSQSSKLPAFRRLSVQRTESGGSDSDKSRNELVKPDKPKLRNEEESSADSESQEDAAATARAAFADHFRNQASTREEVDETVKEKREARAEKERQKRAEKARKASTELAERNDGVDEFDDVRETRVGQLENHSDAESDTSERDDARVAGHIRDFNALISDQEPNEPQRQSVSEEPISSMAPMSRLDPPGPVQNAFDRMRPKRIPAQLATITVGDETTTQVIGTHLPKLVQPKKPVPKHRGGIPVGNDRGGSSLTQFSQRLQRFGAEQAQAAEVSASEEDSEDNGADASEKSILAVDTLAAEDDQSLTGEESEDATDDMTETQETHSDSDYVDDALEKAEEDARVQQLIAAAEQTMSKVNNQRAAKALKGALSTGSTRAFATFVDVSVQDLASQMQVERATHTAVGEANSEDIVQVAEEEQETRLSLTVSKADFAGMEIVGQFNLGFILALRRAASGLHGHERDELFIVDQHASDEKFNFERLQAETTVGNQRMVRPVTLDLTAVEEEIVLENPRALEKNGFVIETDTSGNQPVGRRCTLLSLPLSKEVVFDTRDLDELIHLLSESPMLGTESSVPRPSRVRKMFAMRACRSSIMIGKTLSRKQMQTVLAHMGQIDKPWNCPHGRPTMRHLSSLNGIKTWEEGASVLLDEYSLAKDTGSIWSEYLSTD